MYFRLAVRDVLALSIKVLVKAPVALFVRRVITVGVTGTLFIRRVTCTLFVRRVARLALLGLARLPLSLARLPRLRLLSRALSI